MFLFFSIKVIYLECSFNRVRVRVQVRVRVRVQVRVHSSSFPLFLLK